MSLVLLLEVPLAKSRCSSSAVRYPRFAASTAQPNPVAPPPMMRMSQRADLSASASSIRLRSILRGGDEALEQNRDGEQGAKQHGKLRRGRPDGEQIHQHNAS